MHRSSDVEYPYLKFNESMVVNIVALVFSSNLYICRNVRSFFRVPPNPQSNSPFAKPRPLPDTPGVKNPAAAG